MTNNGTAWYYRKRKRETDYKISDRCPFSAAIICVDHQGWFVGDPLPGCCQHCGWNPAEAQRRKALMDIKKGVTEDA